jgi:hypothetical protein
MALYVEQTQDVLVHSTGLVGAPAALIPRSMSVQNLSICVCFESGFVVWDRVPVAATNHADVRDSWSWRRREDGQCPIPPHSSSPGGCRAPRASPSLSGTFVCPESEHGPLTFTAATLSPCTRYVVCACQAPTDTVAMLQPTDESMNCTLSSGAGEASTLGGGASGGASRRKRKSAGSAAVAAPPSASSATRSTRGSRSQSASIDLQAGMVDGNALEIFTACGHHLKHLDIVSGHALSAVLCLGPCSLVVGDISGNLSLWGLTADFTDSLSEHPLLPTPQLDTTAFGAVTDVHILPVLAATSACSSSSFSSSSSSSSASNSAALGYLAVMFADGQVVIVDVDTRVVVRVVDCTSEKKRGISVVAAAPLLLSAPQHMLVFFGVQDQQHHDLTTDMTIEYRLPQWFSTTVEVTVPVGVSAPIRGRAKGGVTSAMAAVATMTKKPSKKPSTLATMPPQYHHLSTNQPMHPLPCVLLLDDGTLEAHAVPLGTWPSMTPVPIITCVATHWLTGPNPIPVLAIGCQDGRLGVLHALTGQLLILIHDSGSAVCMVRWSESSEGGYILVAFRNGDVQIHAIRT